MLTKKEKYSMDIKEIAKEIRKDLKKLFPACKFSIKIERYAGGQSLNLDLVAATFDAFTEAGEDYKQVNPYSIKESKHFTAEAKEVLQRAYDLTKKYNYDDSDSMTDYFDVNFYLHMSIGCWNKPFNNTQA